MKKLLSLFATVLIAVGVNAQKVVSEIDWTQEKSYPAGWLYSEGATVSVTSEGLTIEANPKENANYWEPQIPIIKGFNLEKGGLYQVKITINSPVAGELRLDLGSWDGSGASQAAAINVTKGVKEYTALFLDYPTGCSDAQVLYQCGKLPGKHVIKEVKVIDLNKAPLEGDLNHDGEVNAADVVCLVDIIMKKESHSQPTGSYWYYGTVEDLENGSAPSANTAITYTNEMYKTYTHTKSTWYNLDTSVERLEIPYAEGDIINRINCIAVPVSSGINDILSTAEISQINRGLDQSYKTINGVDYIVWYASNLGRIMGYLINSNPHNSNSYWYYGTVEDLENGSEPNEETAVTYTNDMYETFDATGSTWYKLDTSIERIHVPYAPLFLKYDICCVAVPVSSGFNDILDLTNTSMIGISVTQSNKTINGIEYIVWIARGIGRLMGYLIK